MQQSENQLLVTTVRLLVQMLQDKIFSPTMILKFLCFLALIHE